MFLGMEVVKIGSAGEGPELWSFQMGNPLMIKLEISVG